MTWLMVVVRVIANPASNVFQKRLAHRAADPLFIIGATHALLAIACIPLFMEPVLLHPGIGFWINMIVSGLLAVSGNALLVHALKSSDLSVLGPINAYKPVISLLLAIVLIHEIPTPPGVAGVLLIVAGSYFVVDRAPGAPRRSIFIQFFQARGIQLRFAALALSATEAVFLKKALLLASPLTAFVWWCVLGLVIAAGALAVLRRGMFVHEVRILRQNASNYVLLAITTGLMQFTTLYTFGKLPVGYSLALFQLSAVISVFFGHLYFQERDIRKRLLGSMIMVLGAALIVTFGHR